MQRTELAMYPVDLKGNGPGTLVADKGLQDPFDPMTLGNPAWERQLLKRGRQNANPPAGNYPATIS